METCRNCGQIAYKDGKCVKCFVVEVWSTNSSIYTLGVLLFLKRFAAKAFKNFKYGIPEFHREILYEVLRDEPGWKWYDRQIVVAAPRGTSKTTLLSKGLALACACLQLKKYIVITSKTGKAAQKNLRWIKTMLGTSQIIGFFGDLRPRAYGKRLDIDTIEGKWASDIVVLNNGVTIEAIGMGQQLRSATEGEESNRIDLFIADDIETDENNKTAERRETNKIWFFEAALPTLDVDTGTIVFINTMTHTQSILATLLNAKHWRKKFYQITHMDRNGKEVSLWPEKFPLRVVDAIKENFKSAGRLNSFYKEYYNLVKSDDGFNEGWIRRWEGRVLSVDNENWIEVEIPGSNAKEILPVYLTLGVDMAYSQNERADFSVLLPLAQVYDGRKYILPYSRGRYTVFDDNSDGFRKGLISEGVRLHEQYKFDKVIIGVNGPELGTFSQFRNALMNCVKKPMVIKYAAKGEKYARLKDYLQPEYETGMIYHRHGMDDLQQELVSFGDTTDDILDALYNAMKFSRRPHYGIYKPVTFHHNDMLDSNSNPARRELQANWMVL